MANRLRKYLALFTCMLSLSACAEMELASHVVKQMPIPDNTQSTGYFKVGNSYKIAGKRYYPKETYNFEQTGIASWYGPNFHGKQTANGETFDMYELTAAHNTLQMPSIIRVTNLENGRSIVVRVNDRGPFSKGRILDLSKRSAELLGFKNQGTARVKIQVLPQESMRVAEVAKSGRSTQGMEVAMNQPNHRPVSAAPKNTPVRTYSDAHRQAALRNQALTNNSANAPIQPLQLTENTAGHLKQGNFYPSETVKTVATQPTKLYVQAASFGNQGSAEQFAQSLRATVSEVHVKPALVNGKNYYRVRVGPFKDVPGADGALQQLASIGQDDAIVVVD